ncbi:hypothetical protein PRSM4_036 [Prochlorococcus phage P-RSM4]|uniref:Uncharacterized protein n=1 Tax=Prochlorococcus phage P-RSM4 TaxID=444862 RepID=E3SLS2_9CAUD|nr:hypothetical protein PRSM4_036 [Prochlorococcus phage P-RSM4]ADO98420.1 hypothetical protein PRSM4_036 [Prochlorococcus phage P-RSM4]
MAESVDAPDLKSVGHVPVRVQVSLLLLSGEYKRSLSRKSAPLQNIIK